MTAPPAATPSSTPAPEPSTEGQRRRALLVVGRTGLNAWGGAVSEEWLPQLKGARGIRVYREMSDNDSTVGALLFAIQMTMRQVPWTFEPPSDQPADRAAADFANSCLGDMEHSWDAFLVEALSFLAFGWAWHEIVYKVRLDPDSADPTKRSQFTDGFYGWRKLPIRSQDSWRRWEFGPEGDVTGMVQAAPPDYRQVTLPRDKALHFTATRFKNNPEGRSALRNAYRCFDAETEILTQRGWIAGLDLAPEDEVATLVDSRLIYERPAALNVYEHRGEMLRFSSRHLDLMVTPNHRLWARRDGRDEFEFIEADEAGSSVSFKRDAAWEGVEQAVHVVPAYDVRQTFRGGREGVREHREAVTVPMDDWLPFLGWFLSEGYASAPSRQAVVGITQNEGPKADAIRDALSRLPWHVYEHRTGSDRLTFEICDRQLWAHLYDGKRARAKRIPSYVGKLSARQITLFLGAYALGDGSVAGGGMVNGYGPYDGTALFHTASPGMADDLSVLLLKTGSCPKIRRVEIDHFGGAMYVVSVGKPTRRLQARRIERVDYVGQVWCPTTTSGIVYVRRDGKSCWSGNSWYYKKRLEEIEAIGVERNLNGLPALQVPPELLMVGATAEQVALRNDLEKMLADIRVDTRVGIMYPNEDSGYKLSLLQGSGSTNATTADAIIQRYDRRILQVCLADFILLGHEAVGSFALADSKTSTFSKAVGAWATSIADEFNSGAVPALFRLNRGLPKFPQVDVLPRLKPGDVETRDLTLLAAFVSALASVGYDVGSDANLEGYLRRVAGLPERIAATPAGEAAAKPEQAPKPNEPGPGEPVLPKEPPPDEALPKAAADALDPDPGDRVAVWKAADARLTLAERRVRNVAAQYVRAQYGAVAKALRRERPEFASPEAVEAWLRKALDAGTERVFQLGVRRALEAAMLPAAAAAARLARRVLKAAGETEKAGRRIPVPKDFQRAAANYLNAKAFKGRLAEIGARTQARLRDVLVRGMEDGVDLEVVAERVDEALRLDSLGRAATIARTETLGGMNAAALAGYEEAGAEGKEWMATPDQRTRDPHADADGQVVALADPFEVGGEELMFPGDPTGSAENVINCLLPGTVVSGAIQVALQADYAGPARELHTARGHRLRVTPNHLVLTTKGWLPAHALHEGDELFSDRHHVIGNATLRQVNDDHAPAPVEQIFEALARDGGTRRTVEVCPLNLHGDARFTQGKVYIVRTDGVLGCDPYAAIAQGVEEGRFVGADSPKVPHLREGSFAAGVKSIPMASAGRPSGSELAFDGGGVALEEGPLRAFPLGAAAHWYTALSQTTEEQRARYAEFSGQLLEASAGAIALDRLVEVRNIAFRGHVYDLQSVDGWIIAGSIVTSNCRCTVAPAAPPKE